MNTPLSLYELNRLVRGCIDECLEAGYWIQAELSEVHPNRNGHCYVEFVQKEVKGNALVAKARGVIWANVYALLKPYFEQETGQPLAAGMKVLVEVTVTFHELYGYSLTVTDIDPTYTLGDLARRRKEILQQLADEGVLELNKELPMPLLPQRVAVISAATAAGYGDFCRQLSDNAAGYVFYPRLFPAVMQGEQTESSIIAALNQIAVERDNWDVVVIIRGGGATSDLAGFDTYMLAANVAQFPLPVITGIGHERDDTVLDCVSHTRVKTPTAAAEYLINRVNESGEWLEGLAQRLAYAVNHRMTLEHHRMEQIAVRLPGLFGMVKVREEHALNMLQQRITAGVPLRLEREKSRLQLLAQRIADNAPERLLKRGYSITLKEGKAVTDASMLKAGDRIITRLATGEVSSEIIE